MPAIYIMSSKKSHSTNIDAVITWVNGNDPKHRKERVRLAKLYNKKNPTSLLTGSDDTRFIENGELKYCLASIRNNTPWINKIYLVTDNQVPHFLTPELQTKYNIEIVDHSTLFKSFEWALPTFNSRTIETMLWRIPGISPRFIYFNDDFIITKPTTPDHFFKDSKIVLRGSWKRINNYGKVRLQLNRLASHFLKKTFNITRSMHLLLQIRSAEAAGFKDQYFRLPHIPHPIYTGTLRTFFTKHEEKLAENIKYHFRDTKQFNSIYLSHHLEIKKNNAILIKNEQDIMLNGELDISFILNKKMKRIKSDSTRFLCLQGYEKFNKTVQEMLHNEFLKLFDNHEFLRM